jgi:hypothetical protein
VQEIDAYWLQRRISQTLTHLDAAAAQQLAQEVLEALQVCLCGVSFLRPNCVDWVASMFALYWVVLCVYTCAFVWVVWGVQLNSWHRRCWRPCRYKGMSLWRQLMTAFMFGLVACMLALGRVYVWVELPLCWR